MSHCKHIFLAMLLVAARPLCGQSFQKEYVPAEGGFVIPYSAAQRPDGKFLVSHMVNDDSIRLYVTCLEPDGTVAWSVALRGHPNITGNEGFVEGPIATTRDTGCIVIVSKSYQSQVVQQGWALMKLGPDGAVQWNRQIAGVGLIDDFLENSEGRTFVVARYPPSPYKRYLACLDDDGTTIWEKDLSSGLGTVAISNVQALPGQRILLMLNTENAQTSAGHLTLLNAAGNISNLLSLSGFSFLDATEHPDGRLFFLGNSADKVLLGMLQSGQLQWAKVLDVPADLYFSGSLAFNAAKDSLVVSYQGTRLEEQRQFMQFDLAGGFSKGHYLPSKEGAFNKMIELPDGGLAWASFSTLKPLRAFVFTKTNPGGRLNTCAEGPVCRVNVRDTVLLPLQAPAWTTENVVHIAVRQAAWKYRSIIGSDYCAPLPVFHAGIFAVDTTACCDETLIFRRDSLTTGTSVWDFPGGIPGSFDGSEPPGVIFPDTGSIVVRHVLEQAGCRDTGRVNILIRPNPEVVLPPDTLVCPGSTVSITAGGAPGWQYHWNDGVSAATREISQTGIYAVTVTDFGGCTDVEAVQLATVGFPRNPLPADTFSCENTPVLIEMTVPGGWQYTWADGFPEPDRAISAAGMYTLMAVSPEGCLLTDSIRVDLVPCPECFVYFPNIIKPEADGENGRFGIQTGCTVLECSMRIFDRWGALVFESKNPQHFWDGSFRGKAALPGVYVFQAEGVLANGDSVFKLNKSGSVTVIR